MYEMTEHFVSEKNIIGKKKKKNPPEAVEKDFFPMGSSTQPPLGSLASHSFLGSAHLQDLEQD